MRVLILTDHKTHTINNSIYSIAGAISDHPEVSSLYIASRGDKRNQQFFDGTDIYTVFAIPHSDQFQYPAQQLFDYDAYEVGIEEFDVIFLRLPRPISSRFLNILDQEYIDGLIINDIQGIKKTSSKAFLLELEKFTAPMALCERFEDILDFQNPCVLKPLESYAGKGIIKIDGRRVWIENHETTYDHFARMYVENPQPYLAMEYLHNLDQGDKRIVVVDGEVLTSSLRYPPKNGWICNVSQGGKNVLQAPDGREMEIIEYLNPILLELGIFYYGLDTLVDNSGQRVISEINTLSIGGITPGEISSGKPLSKIFADHFVSYCLED